MTLDNPSASIPFRMLVMFRPSPGPHCLIRWQVVMTPTARNEAATPGSKKCWHQAGIKGQMEKSWGLWQANPGVTRRAQQARTGLRRPNAEAAGHSGN